MCKRKVISSALAFLAVFLGSPFVSASDLGDADFPREAFADGPRSNHYPWCRVPRNKCEVLFRGPAL